MSYKQQQKQDKKYHQDLMKEFTKEQLATMLIRDRKRKNKYLVEKNDLSLELSMFEIKINLKLNRITELTNQLEQTQELLNSEIEEHILTNKSKESFEEDLERQIIRYLDLEDESEKVLKETEYRLLQSYILQKSKTYRKKNKNIVIVEDFLQYKTNDKSCIRKCIELGIDPYGYTLDINVSRET